MLFFRSEADLDVWLQFKNATHGATLTISQLWQLSQLWYYNRMDVEYHGRSLEQVQGIFKEIGLVSEFWK
jgi:hypothetical protein